MKNSRKKVILTCLDCGEVIKGGSHMSRHVKISHGYSSYDEYKIKHNLIKTESDLKSEGAISCKLCGLFSHDLTSHILRTHKISPKKYKEEYGEIRSEKYLTNQSKNIAGEKNPAYNHNGKYSSLSKNFIYADSVDKKSIIDKISNSNKNNGNNDTTLIYWINGGFTEKESKEKIKERQTTFTLEKCIEKYGKENGILRWKDRQEKWHNSYKKSKKNGYSKISQELFWKLFERIDIDVKKFIFFAELNEDKNLDTSGLNNEYRLNLDNRFIFPDFINIDSKKIIEFDGTYWHGKHIIKNTNRLRDHQRDEIIIRNGYSVLHIKEEDYRNDKNDAVEKCLEFLNG
jgi:uncharacterized C2H2 Zn-finger protein